MTSPEQSSRDIARQSYVTEEELHERAYIDSMPTAEHIDVVLNRVKNGEGGDWAVFTSHQAIVEKLGTVIAKGAFTFTEAEDLIAARTKLKELEGLNTYDDSIKPHDLLNYGFLVGVSRLMDKVLEERVAQERAGK